MFIKSKTKTLFFLMETRRDQDLGLEDYITGLQCNNCFNFQLA